MTLSIEEIEELVRGLDSESKKIKKDLLRICWYMRGSVSIEQAYQLDSENREMIAEIINDNLETTKTSGLPFF